MYDFVLEAAKTDELVEAAIAQVRATGYTPSYREWRNLVGPYAREPRELEAVVPLLGARTPTHGVYSICTGMRRHLLEAHGVEIQAYVQEHDLVRMHVHEHTDVDQLPFPVAHHHDDLKVVAEAA